MKKLTALFLSIVMALSIASVPTAVSAVSVTKKTVMQYKELNLTFSKEKTDKYNCKVENNKKGYIKVDANNEGSFYWLMVKGSKATKSTKPLITVTDSTSGKEVKKFQITVTSAKKIKQSNVKINKGTWKYVYVKNPYDKEHKLSYNKKIVKFDMGYYGTGSKYRYEVKGLKKGTTTVKVKLKGTSMVVGSFKIKVGDFKASLKKSYKKTTLKYNKHLKKSYYLEKGGSINVAEAIKNFHTNSKYTVKVKNTKLVKAIKVDKTRITPKCVEIYALKTGKTKADVFEKRGKSKKKKIGTININVKRAKDAEVYSANRVQDNDGIFYEFFVNVGDRINLKKIVTDNYLNWKWTGSHFKESEYKFSFKASPANVISVDPKTGIYTILAMGSNHVDYTITFADGSKAYGGGSFDIVDDDFWA